MPVEIKVPEVGESIVEVEVGRWLKSPGERVEKEEALVVLETDKAAVELPSPAAGVLKEVLRKEGETVPVGEVLAVLEEGEAGAGEKKDEKEKPARNPEKRGGGRPAPAQVEEQQEEAPEAEETDRTDASPVRVMPAARKALARFGLSPEDVEATGPGGRLTKEDVLRHAGKARDGGSEAPAGEGDEEVPMGALRRTIARRLVEAQRNAALLTTFSEADLGALRELRRRHQDAFRERHGCRLGIMSFFVKAVLDALRLVPQLNAEVRSDRILYRGHRHIGIAVATDRGLVVPVLRDAHRLSFAEIEKAIDDFAARARQNTLSLQELQGGTFTITNGGVYGSLLSTPIVNPPQSGILGMHAIQDRPVARDGQVQIRPMMYLALTYDHRIVDGREAVTFLRRVKECVEEPSRMMLEV